MTAPVTSWTEQPDIDPIDYDDSTVAYDDATTFYNGYDPADFDPPVTSWTDET